MSSQQPFNTVVPNIGEVQHIHFLSEHIGALYLNDEYSDVTLVVENHRFYAHKVILAARSEYFRALLYGGMKESGLNEIELKDTPLSAFKQLLKYIYVGQMTLSNQKDEQILEILGLAHKYGFQDLESSISDYLKAVLSIKNVCMVYDMASLYALEKLMHSCCFFMDRHAVDVIQHESFSNLSGDCVRDIISRDSFCAPEVEIFKAVTNWVKVNEANVQECEQILANVRLSLIPTQDLLKVVRPTNLVQPDVLLDAIQSRTESRDMELKYRGYLIPEENVATPKHGASVIFGEVKSALLDGDSSNYDMERGFSRHPIDDSNDKAGIVVKLGMQCIINHFRMLLWDKDNRSYSYYIEVSMDQKDWVRVIDHSKYWCRSWQDLYFCPRVVRYIRIVGTYNTLNKVFHVVSLEAYYTKKSFQLDKHGISIPKENMATLDKSASVQDGVSRSRHALLNGDTSNYDWDSGYTCHQLGSGSICVQLGQPYAIDSMKLLLWDCDDRRYSYYIEVSNSRDGNWHKVWDRSNSPCQSWQTINFPRRPVVFIRIVGTHNTENEVFHCVHFECPALTKIENSNEKTLEGSSEASFEELDDEEDENEKNDEEMMMAAAALPVTNNYENASQQSQNSQQSSPISVGHFALGASACSMAKNHNVQQFPTLDNINNSRSTSPPPAGQTMQQNPGSGSASGSGSGQRNFETQSPARSVDEAASALAQLLDIDQESSPPQASSAPSPMQNPNQRSGSTGSTGSSRRVYQHALSVRVPPNNPQQQQQNSGAIPRRKRQQNNTNEESS